MLFGLRNVGQSFQHFMDQVLEGVPQQKPYGAPGRSLLRAPAAGGAGSCPQQGEVYLQRLTGGRPRPRGRCHQCAAAPSMCVGHLRLPTALFKSRALEVPGDGQLLPPFHLQSSLHPQATDECHTWARQKQHAGGVDLAAGFCIQTSQSGIVRHSSFSSPTSECH